MYHRHEENGSYYKYLPGAHLASDSVSGFWLDRWIDLQSFIVSRFKTRTVKKEFGISRERIEETDP